MTKLQQAQAYIEQNKNQVDPLYRLNYHLMPEIGWMNDPNGFCYYEGAYHLFYQFHPYDSVWGPMHWAHAVSKDLITWKHLDVALAPDEAYDKIGCFSGSAIEKEGKLYTMYTGCTSITDSQDHPEDIRQIQCLAYSEDGIHFNKIAQNPVIGSEALPEGINPQDFRDPKVFEKDGTYYVVIAAKHAKQGGQILLYTSKDLVEWTYKSTLASSNNALGIMWECPDFFTLEGQDILIMSPMRMKEKGNEHWNINSVIYMVGKMDEETGKLHYDQVEEMDYGLDFYAPQTTIDNKGRRIVVAWMQAWGRTMPTHAKRHKWAGAMTMPRELKWQGGKLYQVPLEEIKNYRSEQIEMDNVEVEGILPLEALSGRSMEIQLVVDMKDAKYFGINLFKGRQEKTVIYYDQESKELTFDRSNSAERIEGEELINRNYRKVNVDLVEGKLQLDIFVDHSSVELFINKGEKVMTSTVFVAPESDGVEIFSEGQVIVEKLCKWTIKK